MIQFDYPSGGIGRKERKRYTFSGFRGVDTSVAEINVAPIRAVESTNFVDRNGVLHKRYGWEQQYQFDEEINGFWRIILSGVTYTLCYAGQVFYRLSEVYGWKEEYTSNKLVSRRTACYVQNDKAYFIGCGDLLVFRFDSESGTYQFFSVQDDTETYIPTTTAQILPEGLEEEGLHGRYIRDSVNLLTGWRKNTLVGRVAPESGNLLYKIDSVPEIDSAKSAYLSLLGVEHKFSYTDEAIVFPQVNDSVDDVRTYFLNISSHSLTGTDETELIEPSDSINYPDIEYDAIKEEGSYGDWVVKLKGKNGAAGLRWKRERDNFFYSWATPYNKHYRAYTLYFIGDAASGYKEISVLRRYYICPIEESTADYEIGYTREVGINQTSFIIKASKIYEEDKEIEFKVEGILIAKGKDNDTTRRVIEIIIPKGSLEAEQKIVVSDISQVTNSEIQRHQAKKIIYTPTPISAEEIKAQGGQIDLPALYDGTRKLSDFLTSETASVEEVNENYQKILSFCGASLICEDDDCKGTIDKFGILHISHWALSENSSIANVELKFYVNLDKSEWISSCKYSTLYGVDGGADRLFVANGNDRSKSNIIFFSEMNDFTYFHDNFTKAVGGNANEVQGFIRLANGSMAALKTLQGNEPTVFVFNGTYISGYYDADEKEPYTLPQFLTSGVSTTQGVVAPYACANLADDSLFLSQNGVYALELSQGTDSQRFAKERSLPINDLLRACNLSELKEACGITHENKYYLAVKHYKRTTDKVAIEGKNYYEKSENGYISVKIPNADLGMSRYYEQEDYVYVADAHYSFTPAGAMSDAPSYEWYPLINIPIRLWFLLDGELYFGTEDGRVCKFIKDQYYDVRKVFYASATEINGSKIKKYSQSTPKSITSISDSNETGMVDTFTVSETADIEDGDLIVFLAGNVTATVDDELKDLLNTELYIKKDTNGKIQFKYRKTDVDVLEFLSASNVIAAVLKKQVVKASRTLPTFDFGMPDYLKTLESFTITMNSVEGGELCLDIYTRNNLHPKQNVKGQSRFNTLEGVGATSFNVPFQNSYTKKICVRNFNYAILEFYNETPTDCSVASISVLYKYNQASGGIK